MQSKGQYPILRMAAIQGGSVSLDDLKYVDLPENIAAQYHLRHGDILFNRTNSGDLVGKVGIYRSKVAAVFASYLIRLKVNSLLVDPYFLGRLLDSHLVQCRIRRYATPGVQQVNINASNLQKVMIALPLAGNGLDEQRAIARILDAADAVIESTRAAIAKAGRVKRGLMQLLLPPWIGFKRVEVEALGINGELLPAYAVARVLNGSTPSRAEQGYWRNGTVPWLATGKVNDRIIKQADEFVTEKALAECCIELLPRGTVLVGMIGQGKTRGMAAFLDIAACINQNFGAFVPGPRLHGKWLCHFLDFHYTFLREIGGGTNQGALNCYLLKRIQLPILDPKKQTEVAGRLDACDDLIHAYERKVAVLEKLKRGLMQDLLTGRVRVARER